VNFSIGRLKVGDAAGYEAVADNLDRRYVHIYFAQHRVVGREGAVVIYIAAWSASAPGAGVHDGRTGYVQLCKLELSGNAVHEDVRELDRRAVGECVRAAIGDQHARVREPPVDPVHVAMRGPRLVHVHTVDREALNSERGPDSVDRKGRRRTLPRSEGIQQETQRTPDASRDDVALYSSRSVPAAQTQA
jgi:hypothetical protein